MKVILAKTLGTCSGVKQAIQMALKKENANNLTILGELVHNPQVVSELGRSGIQIVTQDSAPEEIHHKRLMITAHGIAQKVKRSFQGQGFELLDATCPLVDKVHKILKGMVSKGCFPVVIGRPDHVEVRGIVGDFDKYVIIQSEKDLDQIKALGPCKLGVVSQTTNPWEKVEILVEKVRELENVLSLEFQNTVCKPTRDRQKAALELAQEVDLVLVIGGKNSSNTKKLLELCLSTGVTAFQIESAQDIEISWFKDVEKVGITAGASTPEQVIGQVVETLEKIK